jgi:NAD(P)-dependent dehydrogenase (short-subunit alcohol dehydrogenase family)
MKLLRYSPAGEEEPGLLASTTTVHTFPVDVSRCDRVQDTFCGNRRRARSRRRACEQCRHQRSQRDHVGVSPVDAWETVLKVNLTGTFLCCRTAVLHMIE